MRAKPFHLLKTSLALKTAAREYAQDPTDLNRDALCFAAKDYHESVQKHDAERGLT